MFGWLGSMSRSIFRGIGSSAPSALEVRGADGRLLGVIELAVSTNQEFLPVRPRLAVGALKSMFRLNRRQQSSTSTAEEHSNSSLDQIAANRQ